MDVVKMADHIIDLGPEGGSGGGTILYQGDVYGLLKVKASHTAQFLKQELV
jgi:excinuclease ABC subunit A